MPDADDLDRPSAELLIALGRDREAVEAAAREARREAADPAVDPTPDPGVDRTGRHPMADDGGAAPAPHDREEPR